MYNTKYFDCTNTLFTELLAEKENMFLSVAEVGNILRERYILSPKIYKVTRKNIKKVLIQQKKQAKLEKELEKAS